MPLDIKSPTFTAKNTFALHSIVPPCPHFTINYNNSKMTAAAPTVGAVLHPPAGGAVPSGLTEQTLLLDSDIRDWVVLPLLVIMVCAGLLRHFSGLLLRANPKPVSKIESRAKNVLSCAARIRTGNANYLSHVKWEARRRYYSDKEDGYLRKEAEWATKEAESEQETAGADPMNPMAMMDGMKGNMGESQDLLFNDSFLLSCL